MRCPTALVKFLRSQDLAEPLAFGAKRALTRDRSVFKRWEKSIGIPREAAATRGAAAMRWSSEGICFCECSCCLTTLRGNAVVLKQGLTRWHIPVCILAHPVACIAAVPHALLAGC
jgi:hypothetical protein